MIKFSILFNFLGLDKGHERTVKAKKNIAASFVIKGLNIAIGLILVPLTINYLNPTKYGIWITLSSVIGWFAFFDIGLGHGLRNRFAEALAVGNQELAKTYVSVTYAILIIIISVLLLLFFIANFFVDWNVILNTGTDSFLKKELSILAIIVFASFGINFVLQLIRIILTADQQPAKGDLLDLIGKSLSLFFIYILTRVSDSSLLLLGLIYCSVSPLVLLISSTWFFSGVFKPYKPSIKSVDFSKAKDLFSLGAKFFVIQIAGVLMFQTNNIIISQLFGPAEVTPYIITFKYFNLITMVFFIVITPFWSAFTEAWVKKEIDWIMLVMKKLLKIWGILLIGGIFMLIISPFVYRLWIGNVVTIPFSMSVLVFLWNILFSWTAIFTYFLNGVGKIRLQLYCSIFTAIINIPLDIFLGKHWGMSGLLLANVLTLLFAALIAPVQYNKIIKMRATGIWNK